MTREHEAEVGSKDCFCVRNGTTLSVTIVKNYRELEQQVNRFSLKISTNLSYKHWFPLVRDKLGETIFLTRLEKSENFVIGQ